MIKTDREGIAISTFGKVIKRGWDWLALAPSVGMRVSGLIEVPELAACLTLSKNDFIRTGTKGASYLAYRKAIQEVVSRRLADWGDARKAEPRPRTVRLERDLERVLEDLADQFPLLRSLVDRRRGGQTRLPMPGRGDQQVPQPLFANPPVGHESPGDEGPSMPAGIPTSGPAEGEGEAPPVGEGSPTRGEGVAPGDTRNQLDAVSSAGTLETAQGRRRPARYGLQVQFESRPADTELGRLVESTIWINDAHPAYTRAFASRSLGYHTALAVALALAPLAVEAHHEHEFITEFLAHWGGAQVEHRGAGRRRTKKRA